MAFPERAENGMHRSMVGGGGWESEGGGERGEERGSSTRDAIVIFSPAKSVEVVCKQELGADRISSCSLFSLSVSYM